ncbi:MAG: FitA-like ribbon-helix-helix domain-containing protein [Terriglobia bacterium]
MATLYVENVPDDLYEALRGRARQRGKSIAAEVISLLEESIPTAQELKSRRQFLRQAERLRSRKTRGAGPFPSAEQMRREDRAR